MRFELIDDDEQPTGIYAANELGLHVLAATVFYTELDNIFVLDNKHKGFAFPLKTWYAGTIEEVKQMVSRGAL